MPRKKINTPADTATQPAESSTPTEPTQPTTLTPSEIRELRTGLGVSREVLAKLSQTNGSTCWRVEQEGKEVPAETVAKIIAALRQVEEHGLPDEFKPASRKTSATAGPSKADLAARLATVRGILEEATALKTNAQLRACLDMALAAASGTDQSADEPAPASPESPAEPSEDTPADEPAPAVTDELVAA